MAAGQPRMLAAERRQRIVDMLENHSSVLISDICRECGVSAVTARGDLDYLEGEGRLKRTHGGAVPITEYVVPRVSERVRKNVRAKQAIARAAAERVSDGEMILVGSGSTTLEFVKALRGRRGVSIVTNSCHIIEYAEQHLPEITVMCTGGTLSREYRHYYGPLVAASLADIYLDQVFLGADGFEPSFGFLAEYEETAHAKVEFLRHARTRVVLMDSSKVGAGRSFLRFARPDGIDVVIMDRDPGRLVADACAGGERDVRVIEALADD
ncbi:DeoR/GlpR family DNA-binding transcription regulator [Thermophilibacter sp.]